MRCNMQILKMDKVFLIDFAFSFIKNLIMMKHTTDDIFCPFIVDYV